MCVCVCVCVIKYHIKIQGDISRDFKEKKTSYLNIFS